MISSYYIVRVARVDSRRPIPGEFLAFLRSQSHFHELTDTDFVFAAPNDTLGLREKINTLLGTAGKAEVNAITFDSRP